MTTQTKSIIPEKGLGPHLAERGHFLRGEHGKCYYHDRDSNTVTELKGSGHFKRHVFNLLGAKRFDKALKDALRDAVEYGQSVAQLATTATLSCYSTKVQALRVKVGGGKIVCITANGMKLENNFEGGVLFVDEPGLVPPTFDEIKAANRKGEGFPQLRAALLDQLPPPAKGGLTVAEMGALIVAFWIGIFVRDLARARPILAPIGPPESGKTDVARRLVLLLYGKGADVSGGASLGRAVKDLAASVTYRSFVARDDLNDAPDGMMDLICRIATGAKFELSKFHETLEMESYDPIAAIAITAHMPKWALRRDVLSRLLPLRFALPPATKQTGAEREQLVLDARAGVWAETLKALRAAVVSDERWEPITRFPDWENIVRRVAKWSGNLDVLESGLRKLAGQRTAVVVAADPFLGLLRAFAEQPGMAARKWTSAGLADALAEFAGARLGEKQEHYADLVVRNPQTLGKLLSRIEREGAAVVVVTREPLKAHGNKVVWRIRPL